MPSFFYNYHPNCAICARFTAKRNVVQDTYHYFNHDYCKYCYKDGEFIDKVSMEEYIDMCSKYGAQAGMTNEEMKAYCEKLFPTLKRWSNN